MDFIHQWWPHITAVITAGMGFLFKDKVLDFLKWMVERLQPDKIKALEIHEQHDDERFADLKGSIADAKADILQALNQNVGYIREDMKTERESTEKRMQFLEKVFLDSRLQ